jgi:hypothetical protein
MKYTCVPSYLVAFVIVEIPVYEADYKELSFGSVIIFVNLTLSSPVSYVFKKFNPEIVHSISLFILTKGGYTRVIFTCFKYVKVNGTL